MRRSASGRTESVALVLTDAMMGPANRHHAGIKKTDEPFEQQSLKCKAAGLSGCRPSGHRLGIIPLFALSLSNDF